MVAFGETVGLTNTLFCGFKKMDRSHVDDPGTSTRPFPRHLVMTTTDRAKSLNNLSLFAIHKGAKGIVEREVTIFILLTVKIPIR